jgi:hypothetical protein
MGDTLIVTRLGAHAGAGVKCWTTPGQAMALEELRTRRRVLISPVH